MAGAGVLVFADVLRMGDVLHVDDDVLLAARDREQIVVGGEHIVHAAREVLIERRCDFRMRGCRDVENHHAVDAVRRAFAAAAAHTAFGDTVTSLIVHRRSQSRSDDVVDIGDVESSQLSPPRAHRAVVAPSAPYQGQGPAARSRRYAAGHRNFDEMSRGVTAALCARCSIPIAR